MWAHSAAPSAHHYLPPASSSAPGLIKIYGDALSSGANYRSLLASVHSTARYLIAQVITRYIERERDEADDAGTEEGRILSFESLLRPITGNCFPQIFFIFFKPDGNDLIQNNLQCYGKRMITPPPLFHYFVVVQKYSPEDFLLCDVIGKPNLQPDGAIKWETECRRSVAPWECPLLLVDMWRPKDGFERRFEIQRKEDYEREERDREKLRENEEENCQGQFETSSDADFFPPCRSRLMGPVRVHRRALAAQQDVLGRRARGGRARPPRQEQRAQEEHQRHELESAAAPRKPHEQRPRRPWQPAEQQQWRGAGQKEHREHDQPAARTGTVADMSTSLVAASQPPPSSRSELRRPKQKSGGRTSRRRTRGTAPAVTWK